MSYSPPERSHWTGRKTPPGTPPDYWHQVVEMLNLEDRTGEGPSPDYALLGYACDEGVRRNQGRTGAAAGPESITKQLGSVANHFGTTVLADAGSVSCPDGDLEATQVEFGRRISQLLGRGITPIGLGGGHDIAYAHYLGLQEHLDGQGDDGVLGVLNFDAHFDLRPHTNGPTSGTPFRQILEEGGKSVVYFPIGIQPAANPPSLFRTARDLGVGCVTADACRVGNLPVILQMIGQFLDDIDHLYVTVDLDGFSSAYAPGVSAPSPTGFSPAFFFPLFRLLVNSGKLLSLDLAEYNPGYDRDGHTAKLAGRIIAAAVQNDGHQRYYK